jgi:Protein of unknown function (DUF1045)
MPDHQRFAIYYLPPGGAFADRTADWLGWSAARAERRRQPDLPVGLAGITQGARRYGFHGTVKAPFRLAEGVDADRLSAACRRVISAPGPVVMPGLEVVNLDGFVAMTPVGDPSALNSLAADVVRGLDPCRAPLTAGEVARRNPDFLSDRQRRYLHLWGYPYVMEEFRFHLTLTDNLPDTQAKALVALARTHFEDVMPTPFVIRDLCLCGERSDGYFEMIHRYPLAD